MACQLLTGSTHASLIQAVVLFDQLLLSTGLPRHSGSVAETMSIFANTNRQVSPIWASVAKPMADPYPVSCPYLHRRPDTGRPSLFFQPEKCLCIHGKDNTKIWKAPGAGLPVD
jgi:hypothetical protein